MKIKLSSGSNWTFATYFCKVPLMILLESIYVNVNSLELTAS